MAAPTGGTLLILSWLVVRRRGAVADCALSAGGGSRRDNHA